MWYLAQPDRHSPALKVGFGPELLLPTLALGLLEPWGEAGGSARLGCGGAECCSSLLLPWGRCRGVAGAVIRNRANAREEVWRWRRCFSPSCSAEHFLGLHSSSSPSEVSSKPLQILLVLNHGVGLDGKDLETLESTTILGGRKPQVAPNNPLPMTMFLSHRHPQPDHC